MASQQVMGMEEEKVFKTDFSPSGNVDLPTPSMTSSMDHTAAQIEAEKKVGVEKAWVFVRGIDDDEQFGLEDVVFNGKKSVTWRCWKKGPTKEQNRLDNKKTDITLPNGVKTWYVLFDKDVKSPEHGVRLAMGEEHFHRDGSPSTWGRKNILRGQTPEDRFYIRPVVSSTRTYPSHGVCLRHATLAFEYVFLWGGCVEFVVRTMASMPLPRRQTDLNGLPAIARTLAEQRRDLCRAVTEAAFHPDRVVRMEAVYGDEWDDSFHTCQSVGKGMTDEERLAKQKEIAEREWTERQGRRDARWEAMRMDALMWD